MHKLRAAAIFAAFFVLSSGARADWKVEFKLAEGVGQPLWINPIHWELHGRSLCWHFHDRYQKTNMERYANGAPAGGFHDDNNTWQPITIKTDPDNDHFGPCGGAEKWMEIELKSYGRHRKAKTGEKIKDELMIDRLFSFKITGGGLINDWHYFLQGAEVVPSSYLENEDLCTTITFYGTEKPDKIFTKRC